eukprot:jgi/Chlat1/7606/Chrsp64S07157
MPGGQSSGDGASAPEPPPPPSSSSSNGPHGGSGRGGQQQGSGGGGGGGRRRLWPPRKQPQSEGGGAGGGGGGVAGDGGGAGGSAAGGKHQHQQHQQPAWRQKPLPDAQGNTQSDQQQKANERISNNGMAAQQTSSEQSSNTTPTTPATAGAEAKSASIAPKAVKAVIRDHKGSSKGDRPEPGRFVAYLPRDSDGNDAQTQAAINTINEQLATVLRLPAKEFWQFVVRDASLMKCLDSYLRFRRRPADIEAQSETRVSVPGEEELARRVFMTLYRMSSPKSLENASDGLPAQQHGEMLYRHWLFDIPMLMDICAIYGQHNSKLTAQLVSNVLTAQPKYLDDMRTSGAQLATTLNELCDRCENTAVELVTSNGAATVDTHRVATEMIDVAEFLHDMCHTLDAFVIVYPAAAALLVTAAGPSNEKLLPLLARVYDSIIPPLERGLSALLSGTEDGTPEALLRDHAARLVSHVRRRTRALSWTLLHSAYFIAPAIKDAEALGGELMGTLADMSGVVGSSTPTLLQTIERRFHLSRAVDQATKTGDMRVDDVQLEFLHSLLGSYASAATAGTIPTSAPVQKLQPTVAQLPDRRIAKQQQQTDDVQAAQAAAQSSLITQIQDVLPEYGAGFLAACLDVYDNDPEKVMHHILDGSLPDDLASLDTTLQTRPAKLATSPTDKGKGKAVLQEPEVDKKGKGKAVVPSIYRASSTAGPSSLDLREAGPGPSSSVALAAVSATGVTGRYVRKTTGDESMYDDEYDDSYDELLYTTNSDETADAAMEAVRMNTTGSSRQSAGFGDSPQVLNKPVPKQSQASSSQAPSNSTMYEKDGKLYNYKKDGAKKTTQAQFEVAKAAAATAIHGLGAGGNKGLAQPREDKRAAKDDDDGDDDMEDEGGNQRQDAAAASIHQSSVRGRGRGGALNQPRREHHSGFVGKHRRREGALKKHLAGLGGH